MLIIAGLGNPGARYANNRHNIGFMAVDEIARVHDIGPWRAKFQSAAAEGVLQTEAGPKRVLLLKPQTFMNESGRAVGEAARFFKVEPANVVVFHDELDLAAGKFRLKTGGGIAGHNGLRSISAAIGPEFRRARMGIGHPGEKRLVHGYVLSDFYKAEAGWVSALCEACARAAPLLAEGRDDAFQTRVTHLAPAPKPEADEGETGPAGEA